MGFSPYGGGFDAMFSIVPVFISIIFVLVIGSIIFRIVKGGMEWGSNNHSPILNVDAKVTAKRAAVSRHHHRHNGDMSMHQQSSSTTYFATFEVESGDRMELEVPDKEYGMLAEGDSGKLTFQGTRYKGFERYR